MASPYSPGHRPVKTDPEPIKFTPLDGMQDEDGPEQLVSPTSSQHVSSNESPSTQPRASRWRQKRKRLAKYLCSRFRWAMQVCASYMHDSWYSCSNVQDLYSAGCVLWVTVYNFEALFAMANCSLAAIFYYFVDVKGWGMVSNLSWTFVAIVIVFPLTYEVNMSFRRREEGLRILASINSQVTGVAFAHLQWDWGKGGGGRASLPPDHNKEVSECLTLTVPPVFKLSRRC